MANSYSQVYIQAVFAVKYRRAVLHKTWRQEVFAVMGNLLNETGCKAIIVNGVEDHVHLFFGLKPTCSLSEVMKIVKAKSSKFINESNFLQHRFEWQRGYGVFSYSKSAVSNVYNYIERQEQHHAKKSMRQEYIQQLKRFEIDYDEQYIFEELQ